MDLSSIFRYDSLSYQLFSIEKFLVFYSWNIKNILLYLYAEPLFFRLDTYISWQFRSSLTTSTFTLLTSVNWISTNFKKARLMLFKLFGFYAIPLTANKIIYFENKIKRLV